VKIAITINASWNIYNFRMGLVKALLKNGYEVIAIAPEDDFSHYLTEAGCHFYPLKMQNKGSNPMKDFFLMRQLYSIYKESKPDIILHFTIKPNIYGTLAAWLLNIPVINNVSGLGTVFLHNNLVSKIATFLYWISFRHARKVFFQNNDDRQLFINKKLVKEAICGLLPGSGVNIEKYNPGLFKRNNPFTFLLIARLLYDKGIKEYIEAIRIFKKSNQTACFQLMGALDKESTLGIPESELKKWKEDGLIEYIPFNHDVLPYLAKADCIVLPSYREGTPKTLLEGSAMSKPLIATDVPGCRDVVQEGVNGYLCKVKDPDDLATKMLKISLLSDSTLAAMGQKSREMVVSKYDEKIVIQSYLEEINLILSGKNQIKY
jgi:glycosyltransferase involved in cell wall biosynthesis